MMQRKNKVVPSVAIQDIVPSSPIEATTSPSKPLVKYDKPLVATVYRPTCGTSPFSKHWLNLDCCGLFCAVLTYALHVFGAYAFGWILVPSGWTIVDEDGYRELSIGGILHRTLFCLIAILASLSHFKAMTTDPGAVPPDANPLPELEDLDWVVKGETSMTPIREEEVSRDITAINDSTRTDSGMNIHSPTNRDGLDFLIPQTNVDAISTAANMAAVATVGVVAAVGGMALAAAGADASFAEGEIRINHHSTQLPPRGRRMCRRCQAFKPPRAHHCSICKRCIIKMDHHCPWVNNCVGIGNHKFFLLFIFYTSMSCMYSLSFIVFRFINCVGRIPTLNRCVDHASDLLPLIGLTVEALLFGLFTICMMVDQWDVVATNLTHIDRLKGDYHHHHGILNPQNPQAQNLIHGRAGVHEVFGSGSIPTSSPVTNATQRPIFNYTWLSPFHRVCFPDPIRDDIFGYCRPCGGFGLMNFSKEGKDLNSMEMVGRGESLLVGVTDIV